MRDGVLIISEMGFLKLCWSKQNKQKIKGLIPEYCVPTLGVNFCVGSQTTLVSFICFRTLLKVLQNSVCTAIGGPLFILKVLFTFYYVL